MECYRCGSEDHLYRDCPEPSRSEAVNRALSFDDHVGRISNFIELWFDGTMTMQQKRQAIAAENYLWYGRHLTRSGVDLTRA